MNDEINTLCKIRDIQRSIITFEAFFSKEYGISLNEGMLLCSLLKNNLLSSGELSELLGLTLSNTSKVILSAEKKGLIHRILGASDKRQMYFSLTEKGKELILGIQCQKIDIPDILRELVTRN